MNTASLQSERSSPDCAAVLLTDHKLYISICPISLYRVVSATWLGVLCRTNI